MMMSFEKALCSFKIERSTVSDPLAKRMDNKDSGHSEQPQYLKFLDLGGASWGSAATICSP